MKCLVLGGTGFIGKTLIEKLVKQGHFVRAYSLSQYHTNTKEIEHVQGDFATGENLELALRDIDVVYHLISSTLPSLPHSKSIEDIDINLIGTIRLLNLMVTANTKKIIFASSGGTVYGIPKYLPLDENHPTNPICSYGITKLAIEKYLQLFSINSPINAVALRISNPYGPHHNIKNKQGLINTLCHNIIHGRSISIWGDGSIVRDYIHIDDVGNALLSALGQTSKFTMVNISSGIGLSVNAVIEKVLSKTGGSPTIQYLEPRSFDIQECVLSNSLAKQQLDWFPLISIDEGIAQTIQWLKAG
jgi:UDP-glucose 4-epimerase